MSVEDYDHSAWTAGEHRRPWMLEFWRDLGSSILPKGWVKHLPIASLEGGLAAIQRKKADKLEGKMTWRLHNLDTDEVIMGDIL